MMLPALVRGRRRAEELMVETVRIDRVIHRGSDGHGNTVVTLLDPPVYEGPGKVQTYEPHEATPDVAGATVVMQRYAVQIPVGEGPVEVGDFVTRITPGKPERVFRVGGTHEKTYQTAQRLLCDEQTGGIQ